MERTLAILKPDCVQRNLIGKVIEKIETAGFKIIGMKMIRLSKESARGFYAVHRERPFFNDLVEYMTSGFCVPM
ncbi:MAG: nucleoside-diphosphate kinase, partial [Ignavibacteria bacterium]